MCEQRYAIRTKLGLMGKSYADMNDAKKDAQGFFLSRSSQTGKAEIVPLVPGIIGGVGPAICTVTRKKPGGPLVWKDQIN